jgi:hypothetical protein
MPPKIVYIYEFELLDDKFKIKWLAILIFAAHNTGL